MRPIFISYRRDDSEGQAGRLFEDLREVFGADKVFMDVVTIEPGVDFRRVIEKNTESCGVLLALVGRQWLNAADDKGRRRLDDPNDFVRLETAAALKRDIPVIPVLLQGARMPRQEDLPEDLRDFAFRNSVELTHARWSSDVQILIEALRKVLSRQGSDAPEPASAPAPPRATSPSSASRPPWLIPAAGAAAVAAVLGGWLTLRDAPPPSTPQGADPGRIVQADPPVAGPSAASSTPASVGDARAAATSAAADEAARKEAARKEAARKAARQAELTKQAERERQAGLAAQALRAQQAELDKKAAQQRAADEARAQEARDAETRRQNQIRAHNEGLCVAGFVWRNAQPSDKACVTPDVRARTAAENRAAATTRSPTGGPYGPNTCKQGYVWREAYPGDLVCVEPSSRQQAANDNAQAARRIVPLPR